MSVISNRLGEKREKTNISQITEYCPTCRQYTGELLHYSCVLNELATGHITETKT